MMRENKALVYILFSMMFIGCYATIAQVLIIREFLVIFFGNELCFGIILGTWLFGVAFGAATGGRVVSRFNNHLSAFIIVQVLMCFILPLGINFHQGIKAYPKCTYRTIHSVIIITDFINIYYYTIQFYYRFNFPIACKVVRGFTRDSATDIGFVYILESIGSLIGGILFTFVLISRFQPFTITLLFNCILFLNISLILLFFDKGFLKKRKFVACMLLFIFTSFLLVSGVVNRVDNYFVNVRWRSSNPDINS